MTVSLVSGVAGFIGSHVADKLLSLGHTVVGIDNFATGNANNINEKIQFINANINNNDLDYIFKECKFDYVFHLAAFINLRTSITNPLQCFKDNADGSINLIDNCIKYKIKKVIFSSTGGAIYHPKNKMPWNETALASPQSPYGLSKLVIEQYLEITKKLHGLDYTVLRYSNVYGPRQDANGEAGVISIFINNALKNEPLNVFGSGEQTRDFIYVDDVVDANIKTIDLDCDIYNVSSNKQTSINEIIEIITEEIELTLDIKHLPAIVGEVMHTKLSYDKIKEKSGWAPSIDIVEGIKRTIQYFKDNK